MFRLELDDSSRQVVDRPELHTGKVVLEWERLDDDGVSVQVDTTIEVEEQVPGDTVLAW